MYNSDCIARESIILPRKTVGVCVWREEMSSTRIGRGSVDCRRGGATGMMCGGAGDGGGGGPRERVQNGDCGASPTFRVTVDVRGAFYFRRSATIIFIIRLVIILRNADYTLL